MRLGSSLIYPLFLAGVVFTAWPSHVFSQQTDAHAMSVAANTLPDAPQPQGGAATLESSSLESSDGQSQTTQQPAPSATSGAAGETPAAQSKDEKTLHDQAEEQLKAQERQRVAGVMATFNTTTNKDALPLSPGQKFQLFFRSSTDPWPFLLAGVVSGIGQADDSYAVWGQGLKGYAKRYGAAYSDAFIGNFFGNAVLPSLLHEDPRYFQKGTGSFTKRALWAAASTVWCRRDNGKWGPNYSNVVGNLMGAAVARVYYPETERTVSDTLNDGFTVSAEGIVGAEVIEFWPDIARHSKRKRDEKAARLAAKDQPQSPAQPNQK